MCELPGLCSSSVESSLVLTHGGLLRRDGQGLPRLDVVCPALQQQHGPSRARLAWRDERDLGRAGEARVLRPVDEAGQVAVVAVGPARGLDRHRGDRRERRDRAAGLVEDDVVGRPGQPQHRVVLGGRHG
jgi:hypothetical protein